MYEDRIKLVQKYLIAKTKLDAFLVTDAYNIEYLSGISSFSHEEREARILIGKTVISLFTDARYSGVVQKNAPFVAPVISLGQKPFGDLLAKKIQLTNYKKVGFEKNNLSVEEFSDLKTNLKKYNIKTSTLIAHSDILAKLRIKKDRVEVKKIRDACKLTDKTFKYILDHIKKGVSEKELAIKIELFIKSSGADLAFPPIVAFGKNAAIPHHLPEDKKLSERDGFVLFDLGAKVDRYCSDMSRTVFFGKPNKKQAKIYETTLKAQEKAIDHLKNYKDKSFKPDSVHKIAMKYIKRANLPPTPHALGHGIGLQVHELPILSPHTDKPFDLGMVITVEPGIYIPNFGGVRIEDVVLLTENGVEILTKSTKELTVV